MWPVKRAAVALHGGPAGLGRLGHACGKAERYTLFVRLLEQTTINAKPTPT